MAKKIDTGKKTLEFLRWLAEEASDALRIEINTKAVEAQEVLDVLQIETLANDLEQAGRDGLLDSDRGIFISTELLEMPVMVDPDMSGLEENSTLREVIDDLKKQKQPVRKCRVCGCTDDKACHTEDGPCHWVEPDLCSACKE